MKIFVTGGTGFLGTALTEALKKNGHAVTAIGSKEADLTQAGSLDKFAKEKFDQVFHLAAWTQAGDFCLTHAGEQWIINQKLNTNVLTWWKEKQPQAKLIAMGTSCSYDPKSNLKETEYLIGDPIESLYTYAMTKRMLYSGLLSFKKQFDMTYLHVVPSTLYGPGYHTDGRQMHFIFDLIRKIIRGKEFGEPVVLWGDGNQKRELVHRDDFVRHLITLSEKFSNETFNVGEGREHSIREFADLICKKVGFPGEKISYDTSRYVGARSKCLNVEKIRGAIKPYSLTSIEEGLAQTIEWFYNTRAYGKAG